METFPLPRLQEAPHPGSQGDLGPRENVSPLVVLLRNYLGVFSDTDMGRERMAVGCHWVTFLGGQQEVSL